MKIMRCEHCGEEFYSEYYNGGYIDHMNMTRNRTVYLNRFKDEEYHKEKSVSEKYNDMINDLAYDILFHGNDVRGAKDVEIRLNCFLTWKEYDDATKNLVKDMVAKMVDERVAARNKLDEFLKSLNSVEKQVLRSIQLNLY